MTTNNAETHSNENRAIFRQIMVSAGHDAALVDSYIEMADDESPEYFVDLAPVIHDFETSFLPLAVKPDEDEDENPEEAKRWEEWERKQGEQ